MTNTPIAPRQSLGSFDPYSPSKRATVLPQQCALLDTEHESVPTNHVLEMEEESISLPDVSRFEAESPYDPVATSSGLLLTHRRVAPIQSPIGQPCPRPPGYDSGDDDDGRKKTNGLTDRVSRIRSPSPTLHRRHLYRERFEVENPWTANAAYPDSFVSQIQKLFSYAKVWVLLSSLVLILGTVILFHHAREPQDAITSLQDSTTLPSQEPYVPDLIQQSQLRVVQFEEEEDAYNNVATSTGAPPDQIVLVPLDPSRIDNKESQFHRHLFHEWQRKLYALRAEFESWLRKHRKQYRSDQELQYRFNIWTENHHRTREKNDRHGPCKLTKEKVFGSNHFQDLTNDEFEDQFLNAKHIPLSTKIRERKLSSGTMEPHVPVIRHPEVHQRYLKMTGQYEQKSKRRGPESLNCSWLNASCMMHWVVRKYFYGFYGIGMTMEPDFDGDTYPKSVDWRGVGAVTDIRSQDNCGACWAITAVECVESSHFITHGTLYDLAESEVILCVDNSEMCYGGWPEDAFEYMMQQGGIPLEDDLPYDGDLLLAVTQAKTGESSKMSEEDVDDYKAGICPAGSHDSKNKNGGNGFVRHGKITGYAYATDRCVCYSNGSGCDCGNQNEGLAVANLATHGPAVICVDASEWKDYSSGIITSDSGCSSAFLDVNHCLQVVGYAFHSDDDGDDENKSGSGSGSQDNSNRIGYWIVRNQWSVYWGMSGYAYVAMGDNTCGILNDMMQVMNH